MKVAIMIPTRNRCRDLEITCRKLKRLAPPPEEVIIFADSCQDNTPEMLRREFPEFRLLETNQALGSVGCRDRMLRTARSEIVVSLDDDSHPVDSEFIGRLESVLAGHPEAAVVVFPELRAGGGYAAADKTPQSPGHYVSAYANCAAAMRRRDYLVQPGFPAFFGHMYEEPDYALQCYSAGKAVWFEPSLTIQHRQSTVDRFPKWRHHLNARNELWSVWLRCPWPWLPVVSGYRIARQFAYACSEGLNWGLSEPQWWTAAVQGMGRCSKHRQAVAWRIYRRWLSLGKKPIHSRTALGEVFRLQNTSKSA